MKPVPPVEFRSVPLSDLVPAPYNPRADLQPGDPDYENIRASILRHGLLENLVWNRRTGHLVGGHQRLKVLRQAGFREDATVPVAVVDLDEAAEKALNILLNKAVGRWDEGGLLPLLDDLLPRLEEVGPTGFSSEEADRIRARTVQDFEDDRTMDPPVNPVTRMGDLWILGKHRLLCGDATSEAEVKRLLDGATPEIMVTDPPYGVEYDPEWRNKKDYKRWYAARGDKSQSTRKGAVANDDRVDWSAAWKFFPGDVAYVWHASLHGTEVALSLMEYGFEQRCLLIWKKPHIVLCRGHYHWQHEAAWYCVRQGARAGWVGERNQSTIWEIAGIVAGRKADAEEDLPTVHGTQKPLECMARPLRNHSARSVYDPFVGSGTTIIAAEKLNRTCYAIDIDPAYCDVAVERWARLTGKTPVLQRGGETFAWPETQGAHKGEGEPMEGVGDIPQSLLSAAEGTETTDKKSVDVAAGRRGRSG